LYQEKLIQCYGFRYLLIANSSASYTQAIESYEPHPIPYAITFQPNVLFQLQSQMKNLIKSHSNLLGTHVHVHVQI